MGRKASLDASHPQTDEESPSLQGGVLQNDKFEAFMRAFRMSSQAIDFLKEIFDWDDFQRLESVIKTYIQSFDTVPKNVFKRVYCFAL